MARELWACGHLDATLLEIQHGVLVTQSRFERELPTVIAPRQVAELRDQGISRGLLRGRSWQRIRYGLYLPVERNLPVDGTPPAEECPTQRIVNAASLLAPGMAIGGWAAAYALGADWLDGRDSWTGALWPVDLVGDTVKRRSSPDVKYRYADPGKVVVRQGIRFTRPLRTTVDGTRWATSDEEALVFADAMVHAGLITPTALLRYVGGLRGSYRIGRARVAAEMARGNVRSPWESRLRYCYLIEAGLPQPLLNVGVFNDEGLLLGYPDLFDPESALMITGSSTRGSGIDRVTRADGRDRRRIRAICSGNGDAGPCRTRSRIRPSRRRTSGSRSGTDVPRSRRTPYPPRSAPA